MKLLDVINALKLYYKTHNREDIEIIGTLTHPTPEGGEVVLSAEPSGIIAAPKNEVKDPRSRPGVKFTPDQENKVREFTTANRSGLAKDDDSDPKMGRDKSGDGK